MFADGRARVITKEAGPKSVKLADVFEDERWKDAVEMSHMKSYYLTEMSYADFEAAPDGLVLSYRWESEVGLSCAVADPAGEVKKIEGTVNLSFLLTPELDWTHLWVDFLSHLNDGEGWNYVRETSGRLYLDNTVLPQYFLFKSPDKVQEAFGRGWLHAELSIGKLHRGAVEGLIHTACIALHEELGKSYWWYGEPLKYQGLRLLRAFCDKRPLLSDGFAIRPDGTRYHQTVWDDVWQTTTWYAFLNDLKFIPKQFGTAHGDLRKKVMKAYLENFLDLACEKQVPDDPEEVLGDLPVQHIIHAFSMGRYWDVGDQYVAPLAVFAAACGMPIRDPLKEYRLRHANSPNRPQNANGSLQFQASDLDLEVLNVNFSLLRMCWEEVMEVDLKPVLIFDHHEVELLGAERAPGTKTLGFGPLPRNAIPERGVLKVNKRAVLRFKDDGKNVSIGIPQYYEKQEPKLPGEFIGQKFSAEHFGPNYV